MLALVLIAIMHILVISAFFILIRFVEGQEPKIKPDMLEETLRDKCLDIEISIIPNKGGSPATMLMFMSLLLMLVGSFRLYAALVPDPDMYGAMFGLFIIFASALFSYFLSPFRRKARLIISPKLVIMPLWIYRPAKLLVATFRVENIEHAVVERNSRGKRHITGLAFKGRVHGKFRLAKRDYHRYDGILAYLRGMGIRITEE